eukprot:1234259-Rhodomonas_salina.2
MPRHDRHAPPLSPLGGSDKLVLQPECMDASATSQLVTQQQWTSESADGGDQGMDIEIISADRG